MPNSSYNRRNNGYISKRLILKYGKGWSSQHLRHCLRVAETFTESEIVYAVRRQLSWTHLRTMSYENDPIKRSFYLKMASEFRWNTRDLSEQMDKMLFERTALAQKPEEQIMQALTEFESEIRVAQYLTELPSKEWFVDKLHRAIEIAKINQKAVDKLKKG